MAERAATRSEIPAGVPACIIGWTGLLNGDTGAAVELIDYADKTVTITGTFGVGGSITMQGSNNNSDWFALTDPSSTAITKTAAGMEAILEAPRYIRPIVTAGDGTTSLTVQMCCRRSVR
jgi:hypothetical protein